MIRVGTSGWNYPHWRGTFYPRDLSSDRWLDYYCRHFDTVELNKTFYNLPDSEQFASWSAQVSENFRFAVKASRYITHMKKLKAPTQSCARLTEQVRALGSTLGPLLFQLPPNWKQNPDRLDTFISALPSDMDYAFEFRDPSWMNDHIYEILARNNVAFCIYELSGYQSPLWVTSTISYVRLHGPGAAYEGSYDDGTLSQWAQWAKACERDGIDVYIYFDNDQQGYAAANALSLLSLL